MNLYCFKCSKFTNNNDTTINHENQMEKSICILIVLIVFLKSLKLLIKNN